MKLLQLHEGRRHRRYPEQPTNRKGVPRGQSISRDPIRRELTNIIIRVLDENGYKRKMIYNDRTHGTDYSKIAIGEGRNNKIRFSMTRKVNDSGQPPLSSSAIEVRQILTKLNLAVEKEFNSKYTPSVQIKPTKGINDEYFQVYKRSRDPLTLKTENLKESQESCTQQILAYVKTNIKTVYSDIDIIIPSYEKHINTPDAIIEGVLLDYLFRSPTGKAIFKMIWNLPPDQERDDENKGIIHNRVDRVKNIVLKPIVNRRVLKYINSIEH